MEQIKIISQESGAFAIPELERTANQWLKENAGKEILDIQIIFETEGKMVKLEPRGWLVLIRYRE